MDTKQGITHKDFLLSYCYDKIWQSCVILDTMYISKNSFFLFIVILHINQTVSHDILHNHKFISPLPSFISFLIPQSIPSPLIAFYFNILQFTVFSTFHIFFHPFLISILSQTPKVLTLILFIRWNIVF